MPDKKSATKTNETLDMNISLSEPRFATRLAQCEDEIRAVQALRYKVFVEEFGSDGPLVDHEARLERDRFDPVFDHLLLIDLKKENQIVGTYRLARNDHAARVGQFYSESEYDISRLRQSGRKLLELGRSCLLKEYRGGVALHHLWAAVGAYVLAHDVDVLFGVASFHGTDVNALAQPLSLLHHHYAAPTDISVSTQEDFFVSMNLLDKAQVDRKRAMVQIPALIKGYLRLGGFVGNGAFVDHDFKTTDVCLVLDRARMSAAQVARFAGAGAI